MESEISTLYFHNLSERLHRARLQHELRRLCEPYGQVVSIHTSRGIRKRGQAFVSFKNPQHAQAALKNLADKEFFLKPIRVSIARSNSDSLKSPEAIETSKRQREAKRSASPESDMKRTETPPPMAKPKLPENEPHHTLLLQNIPAEITPADLKALCQDLVGYKDARMFAVKHVGFVEFDSIQDATAAIEQLVNRNVGEINFAKK